MTLPILYKKDSSGGTRSWSLEIDETVGAYRTISGSYGGKQTESGWTLCEPKNVGRANETTRVSQAQAEVKAAYQKKLDRGYFKNRADIDKVIFTKPMLAQDWAKVKNKPLYGFTQPKLDGIRCIARADGLWSRSGKPITSVPFIHDELAQVFERDPNLILDGELYNHDLRDDFNQITSLVRKADPCPEAKGVIQYHIYDCIDAELSFDNRFLGKTNDLFYKSGGTNNPHIKFVPTVRFMNLEYLDELYGEWLEAGYEGQMVRIDDPYEVGKRSKTLLKRKEFLTAEFPVVGVEEGNGNWAGYAKKFRLTLPDGREFGAGVRGDQAKLKALLNAPTAPDWATVRSFTATPDGVPRFPVVIDWGFGTRHD